MSDRDQGKSREDVENQMIERAEQTAHEMQDSMRTMMEAGMKLMTAFIDMRLSYLKMLRSGLDDPLATFEMMSSNMRDVAGAMKREIRKQD